MSQELMDHIGAQHDAIVAVLGMLTAEMQLSDEHASALDVTDAEQEIDQAAARLAAAADALPHDRRPVGWGSPPAVAGDVKTARRRFVRAGLRCISAQYAGEHSSADAEAEYAGDQLAIAARNLAAEVAGQAKPPRTSPSPLPLGWDSAPAGEDGGS